MREMRFLHHRQRAFTLVELMISIVIGIFLVSGVITVYMSTRQTSLAQAQLAQLQDDQRVAMAVITDVVQSAGYYNNTVANHLTTPDTALPGAGVSGMPNFGAGQAVAGKIANATDSDSIYVRFQTSGTDGILNCLGGTSSAGVIVNKFTVRNQTLTCTLGDTHQTTQDLLGGIQGMVVLYGVDTDGDGSADRYLNATEVNTGSYWLVVVSVKVILTFINPMASQPGQKPTIALTRVIKLMSYTS